MPFINKNLSQEKDPALQTLEQTEEEWVKLLLTCPQTGKLFNEPMVLVQNGFSYDAEALTKLHYTNPCKTQNSNELVVVPNRILKNIVEIFNCKSLAWPEKKLNMLKELEDPISLETITEGLMFVEGGHFMSIESIDDLTTSKYGLSNPFIPTQTDLTTIKNFTLENVAKVLLGKFSAIILPCAIQDNVINEIQKLLNFIDAIKLKLPVHWQKHFNFKVVENQILNVEKIEKKDSKSQSMEFLRQKIWASINDVAYNKTTAENAMVALHPYLTAAITASRYKQRFSIFKSRVAEGLSGIVQQYYCLQETNQEKKSENSPKKLIKQ